MRPGILFLLIITSCLLLANIYYAQPILPEIAGAAGLPADAGGMIVTSGQIGYICGLLFLAPLGDVLENRKLCAAMTISAGISAFVAASAANPGVLCASMFLMGIFATATQILVVFAITLAGNANRGKILGIIACGLFSGIALSRPIASFITGLASSWRAVFLLSGIALIFAGVVVYLFLPTKKIRISGFRYVAVLRSMLTLLLSSRWLVRRTVVSALTFFGFTMFWSTAPMYLIEKLQYSRNQITVFTLAGLVTPPCMLMVGRLLDKGYGRVIIRASLLLIFAAWSISYLQPSAIIVFCLAALCLDPSSSAVTVSIQQSVLSDSPLEIRGRLNSLNISLNFCGGAAGAAIGPWLLSLFNWTTVALFGAAIMLFLLILGFNTGNNIRKSNQGA